jgi:hypothetical protein
MTDVDLDAIEANAMVGAYPGYNTVQKLIKLCRDQQARLKRFDDTRPDAVLCAEWVATVALQSSDVYQAAKRYLAGEQSPVVAHLERIKKACELDVTEARAYVQSSSAVSTDFFPWVLGRVLQRIKETVDGNG